MENGMNIANLYMTDLPTNYTSKRPQTVWARGTGCGVNETADMQVRIVKLLQDRPRKDLPKNSWDFFTYISKDQLKSAPPEREQSDTHKVPKELQFSHRHNPQSAERVCRSHVKIRTADNESNLTRTKCREGYGENAAPRIQHPHSNPGHEHLP